MKPNLQGAFREECTTLRTAVLVIVFHLDSLCCRHCLRKGSVRVWARKMRRQGVKSASPTRQRRAPWPRILRRQTCQMASRQAERRI